MIITVKLRLKDKHAAELNRQARVVNFVWNYVNETQKKAFMDHHRFLSNYELQKLTAFSAGDLDLNAQTIKRVCFAYDTSRRTRNKGFLRWRGKKSLGWVPFGEEAVWFNGTNFRFRRRSYSTMHMRSEIKNGVVKSGSFNQDARGRWYINVPVEIEEATETPAMAVGIDLGLKDLATLSNGTKICAPRLFRNSEIAITKVQRAKKTKRVRAIHAKVANRRKDFLHKVSTGISKQFGLIIIGDVSPAKLAKTRMSKSVHDAGWFDLKRILSYKSIRNGGSAIVVSEKFSSQACSNCGSLPPSRPRGIAGLSKRVWTCDDCCTVHDRDVNAAINIRRIGTDTLRGGAPYAGSVQEGGIG